MPDERREVALPGGLVGHGCGREAAGAPPRPAASSASSQTRAAGRPGLSSPFPSATPGSVTAAPSWPKRRFGLAQPPSGLRPAPAPTQPWARPGPRPRSSRARPVRVSRGPCETCNSRGGGGAQAVSAPGARRVPGHLRGTDEACSPRGGWGIAVQETPAFLSPGALPCRIGDHAPANTPSGTEVRRKWGRRRGAGNGPRVGSDGTARRSSSASFG